jgi:hypothetical protein
VPDFASHIPKPIEHPLDHFLRGSIGSSFPNENEIDITRWTHFLTTKTTHSSQNQPIATIYTPTAFPKTDKHRGKYRRPLMS